MSKRKIWREKKVENRRGRGGGGVIVMIIINHLLKYRVTYSFRDISRSIEMHLF
jgi:hypothetical protein